MDGILLDRSEFLVLLNAMRATAVVGIDSNTLFPASRDEHLRLVEQGHARLQERGLLTIDQEEVRRLDPLLAMMAAVVARPQLACITVRQLPDGAQLFLHYVVDELVVEQTFPAEGQHRLATLPNRAALFDRLLAIVPLEASAPAATATLSMEVFLEVKRLADADNPDEALALLRQQPIDIEVAAPFMNALLNPVLSATIALLRCANQEIIDARNPLILKGKTSAWCIAQAIPGEPTLHLTRIGAEQLSVQLMRWVEELEQVTIADNPS